jgi:hypothetical protein
MLTGGHFDCVHQPSRSRCANARVDGQLPFVKRFHAPAQVYDSLPNLDSQALQAESMGLRQLAYHSMLEILIRGNGR